MSFLGFMRNWAGPAMRSVGQAGTDWTNAQNALTQQQQMQQQLELAKSQQQLSQLQFQQQQTMWDERQKWMTDPVGTFKQRFGRDPTPQELNDLTEAVTIASFGGTPSSAMYRPPPNPRVVDIAIPDPDNPGGTINVQGYVDPVSLQEIPFPGTEGPGNKYVLSSKTSTSQRMQMEQKQWDTREAQKTKDAEALKTFESNLPKAIQDETIARAKANPAYQEGQRKMQEAEALIKQYRVLLGMDKGPGGGLITGSQEMSQEQKDFINSQLDQAYKDSHAGALEMQVAYSDAARAVAAEHKLDPSVIPQPAVTDTGAAAGGAAAGGAAAPATAQQPGAGNLPAAGLGAAATSQNNAANGGAGPLGFQEVTAPGTGQGAPAPQVNTGAASSGNVTDTSGTGAVTSPQPNPQNQTQPQTQAQPQPQPGNAGAQAGTAAANSFIDMLRRADAWARSKNQLPPMNYAPAGTTSPPAPSPPISSAGPPFVPPDARSLAKSYFNRAGLAQQAQAESHGDPKAENPHSTASGKYQFLDSTWREYQTRYNQAYGTHYNYPRAKDAPEDVQDKVASITPASRWGGKWAGSQGRNAANPALTQGTPDAR